MALASLEADAAGESGAVVVLGMVDMGGRRASLRPYERTWLLASICTPRNDRSKIAGRRLISLHEMRCAASFEAPKSLFERGGGY